MPHASTRRAAETVPPETVPVVATQPHGGIGAVPGVSAVFTFSCGGVPYSARMVESEGGGRLTVVGELGTLPFSCECPRTRQAMKAILSADPEMRGARLRLTPAQRIVIEAGLPCEGTPTRTRLLAAAATLAAAGAPLASFVTACLGTWAETARAGNRVSSPAA